ncbi:MAG TPA: tyrosine-type recombinase/integrase [Terriglobales bacterium]
MPSILLDNHIEPFLQQLRAAGYADRTLRKKRTVTRAFARWATRKRITRDVLNEGHIAAFLARSPRRRKAYMKFEGGGVQLFFRYLCSAAGVQDPPVQRDNSAAAVLGGYEGYLREDRGLAQNSVLVYVPFVRDFLAAHSTQTGCVAEGAFDTLTIRDFLLAQTAGRSQEYIRLLATSLRSFLRFLFLHGELPQDLSTSVPMVRRYRQTVAPAFLSPEEVERVLTATDRLTSTGRRDYAILLLLARLGLRAGEIVALELDDIRWRAGGIIVRGKGRMLDPLPLLSDIGEAVAAYIHEDRGVSSSRRLFLRTLAPHTGLMGPAAVGHIVRRALARADVRRSGRGAAHLFRHGLATKMIRHGASMAEISEVLRHRSQVTTAIYTQVSFEALRTVAEPWPATGGAR